MEYYVATERVYPYDSSLIGWTTNKFTIRRFQRNCSIDGIEIKTFKANNIMGFASQLRDTFDVTIDDVTDARLVTKWSNDNNVGIIYPFKFDYIFTEPVTKFIVINAVKLMLKRRIMSCILPIMYLVFDQRSYCIDTAATIVINRSTATVVLNSPDAECKVDIVYLIRYLIVQDSYIYTHGAICSNNGRGNLMQDFILLLHLCVIY